MSKLNRVYKIAQVSMDNFYAVNHLSRVQSVKENALRHASVHCMFRNMFLLIYSKHLFWT